ncbi:cobalamin biosynthesis protein CbiG [Actinoalloteichus hoggarensis]|uniref:Uncharacterized protein n=1 Tax=Actinoalloteichus hoggarensis TaxID=1470176 RepID=A0A221W865_9PSEU|nr:hypothetical protein AHOG_22475 [Actinoalloteichus hoggarensis]MBB5923810.1 cobalamin biosynthesis protein CbiG [Actinoalloteichus hoggarensis]
MDADAVGTASTEVRGPVGAHAPVSDVAAERAGSPSVAPEAATGARRSRAPEHGDGVVPDGAGCLGDDICLTSGV